MKNSTATTAAATKKRRRLRVCRRRPQEQYHQRGDQEEEQPSSWNLFVRLHARTVQELHQQAIAATAADTEHASSARAGWHLTDSLNDNNSNAGAIEFLPLAIQRIIPPPEQEEEDRDDDSEEIVYASYNGGELYYDDRRRRQGEAQDCIDLSPSLLSDDEQACDYVSVWALPFVPNAAQVHVEPCSQQDWELMQNHAAWLEGEGEDGGLLSQVSVVYPGQVLTLRVPSSPSSTKTSAAGRRMVRLRVISGSVSSNNAADPLWPLLDDGDGDSADDKDDEDDDDDFGCCCCYRLVQDTEVIVAPFLEEPVETDIAAQGSTIIFSLYPTIQDYYASDYDYDYDDESSRKNSPPIVLSSLADRLRNAAMDSSSSRESGSRLQQQVYLMISTHIPPFTALVHPESMLRLLLLLAEQQRQQQEPRNNNDEEDVGGELFVQLRGIPSGNRDQQQSSAAPTCTVVQLRESKDVPVDRIALHPLVRKTLALNLLEDQVVIHEVLGKSSSFRVQQAIEDSILRLEQRQQGQQQLREDEANRAMLRLEPVIMLDSNKQTSITSPRAIPRYGGDTDDTDDDSSTNVRLQPWRRPDILDARSSDLVVAPSSCGSRDMEKNLLTALGAVVSGNANGDLPVGVGSILPLSWTNADGGRDKAGGANKLLYHYRLVMESESSTDEGENEVPGSAHPMFFLARDLPKLLHISFLQRRRSGKVTDLWTGSSESHLPLSLLPDLSVVPACLIEGRKLPCSMGQCSALICGDGGSGKTHSALVVATVARLLFESRTIYLNCRRLKDTRGLRTRDILAALDEVFDDASTRRSCCCTSRITLILDDLDEITPNHESESSSGVDDSTQVHQVNPLEVEQAKMISDHLLSLMESVLAQSATMSHDVAIIITCAHETSIPGKLLSSHAFKTPIRLPRLTCEERECLFINSMQQYPNQDVDRNETAEGLRLIDFANRTESFSPRDIKLIACRVHQRLCSSNDCTLTIDSAAALELETFVPANQLSASLEKSNDSITWDDVGGLSRAKEELIETILRPFLYRRIYQRARIRLPRGVLIFGPPGCGKSFLVPALAKKCRLPLIMCRGPELLDKYIGASEAKVRELFSRAASAAPSILFLDELDSLAPRRGSDHTGVTDRVVNQLLTFLDGVEDIGGGGTVYILAATSRPDKVDPALLRPGRLEKHVYVGFPEKANDMTDVFVKMARQYNVDENAFKQHVESGELAKQVFVTMVDTKGGVRLSPADVNAMFNTAQIAAVREALPLLSARNAESGENGAQDVKRQQEPKTVCLQAHHLQDTLRSTRPSISAQEWELLRQVYRPFLPGRIKENDTAKPPPLRTALK